MDTPRTPRDNLRTSPGLEDLEDVGRLEAPLLPHAEPSDSLLGGGAGSGSTNTLPAAVETKRILGIGAPMVAEEILAYLSTIISVAFAGRLGGFNLGVFTLSHALTNITGIALLNGVTGAVDTFSSQAHGSRTFPAIGVVLQRALLLALLTCIPLMLLYWQALPVLLLLGQEAALAADAARYTRIFAAKIPLHAVALCLYRTLAAQGAAAHVLAASAVYCGVTAPINWALICWLGWGLDGSAAAAVACEAVYVAALVAACAVHNAQQPAGQRWWHGWSRDALRDWAPFAKLSVSSTLMIVLDWWAYDILTFLAGLLPQPDIPVAATGIVYNVQTIVFMLPLGLSFALCARVGHHLGAAQPHSAKLAAEVGTGIGIAATGLPALLIMLLGSRTAALFTDDAAVVRACAPLILPLATVMLTNSATALLGGILRGSGRQKIGAVVNGAANYGVGLPLQLLFAFKLGGGVAGLWWGIAIAATLQALVLAVLVSRFDWQREAGRAAKLVRHLSQAGMSGGEQQQRQQQGAAQRLPVRPGSPEVGVPPLL